jgi:hypothetical protein
MPKKGDKGPASRPRRAPREINREKDSDIPAKDTAPPKADHVSEALAEPYPRGVEWVEDLGEGVVDELEVSYYEGTRTSFEGCRAPDEGRRRSWLEEQSLHRARRGAPSPATDAIRILESTPSGTRAFEILSSVFPTQDSMLGWLTHPHADLGGKTPLEVVEMGYPGAVEGMLEAALMGLPS